MDQVDRGVRFQQVAPGTLTRMGLSGYQQHTQAVTHAVDADGGGIVAVGQLSGCVVQRDLHDVLAGMAGRHRQGQAGVQGHGDGLLVLAVHGQSQGDAAGAAGLGDQAMILDAQADGDLLPDQAKGRGLLDHQAAVPVLRLTGQQHVQRRRHPLRQHLRVMQAAIGDGDHPGQPSLGFGGDGARQGGGQRRAVITVAHGHAAQVGAGQCGDARGQVVHRLIDLRGAPRQGLAGRAVIQQDHDVGQGRARAQLQRRTGQSQRSRQPRQAAPCPAPQPAPQREGRDQHRQRGQHADGPPRQGRVEPQLGQGCHGARISSVRRRSSRAGTCTWSDL